jgi:hypothetical protein
LIGVTFTGQPLDCLGRRGRKGVAASTVFRAGERWSYRAPEGFERSRIVVGAVVEFADREPIVCCAVAGAPRRRPDGSLDTITIPFLPMTSNALIRSVIARDGLECLPVDFATAFQTWRDDPRGLTAFTVPFEGLLEHLIARQMEEIVGGGAG